MHTEGPQKPITVVREHDQKRITCSFYLTEVVVTHVVIDDEAENEIQEESWRLWNRVYIAGTHRR